jgi:DNA-binding sugar fermentation-stimulating protein
VTAVAPDTSIDPGFARALRRARLAGVQVAGLRCSAHLSGMELLGEIPVIS